MKASLQQKLGFGQVMESLRQLGKHFTPEEFEILLKNPGIWAVMAHAAKQQYPFNGTKLVHDVYNIPEIVDAATMKQLRLMNYDPDKLTWSNHSGVPTFSDDPETCVVLRVSLESLAETMRFYWDWIESLYGMATLVHFKDFSDRCVRMQFPNRFSPNTLKWVRLKLNAKPTLADTLAGVEVLALAAQHPERMRVADQPVSFLMAGLMSRMPDRAPKDWDYRPRLEYIEGRDEVGIGCWWNHGDRDSRTLKPIVIEEQL